MTDEPMSIAAAARSIGLNKSTLARQLKGSAIQFYEGKVRLSDVLAFRASSIDLTRSGRRDGKLDVIDTAKADATTPARDATSIAADATDDDPVLVDGQVLSYAVARAMKETYLARLRQLEFHKLSGEVVEVEEVTRIVQQEFSVIRNKIISQPGRLANRLAMRPAAYIAEILDDDARQILNELSNPNQVVDKAARQ